MATLTVEYMDSLPHSELPDPRQTITIASADHAPDLKTAMPLARSLVANLRAAGFFARVNVDYR